MEIIGYKILKKGFLNPEDNYMFSKQNNFKMSKIFNKFYKNLFSLFISGKFEEDTMIVKVKSNVSSLDEESSLCFSDNVEIIETVSIKELLDLYLKESFSSLRIDILKYILNSPEINIEILKKIIDGKKSDDEEVIKLLIKCPIIDAQIIKKLIDITEDLEMLISLYNNPMTSESLKNEIKEKIKKPSVIRPYLHKPNMIFKAIDMGIIEYKYLKRKFSGSFTFSYLLEFKNPKLTPLGLKKIIVEQLRMSYGFSYCSDLQFICELSIINGEMLDLIVSNNDSQYVWETVAKNPNVTKATLIKLLYKIKLKKESVYLYNLLLPIVNNSLTDEVMLKTILDISDDNRIFSKIATNSKVTPEILSKIISNNNYYSFYWGNIINSPGLTKEILKKIILRIHSNNFGLLEAVLKSPLIDREIFELLASLVYKNEDFKYFINSPLLTKETLELITRHIFLGKRRYYYEYIASIPDLFIKIIKSDLVDDDFLLEIIKSPYSTFEIYKMILTKFNEEFVKKGDEELFKKIIFIEKLILEKKFEGYTPENSDASTMNFKGEYYKVLKKYLNDERYQIRFLALEEMYKEGLLGDKVIDNFYDKDYPPVCPKNIKLCPSMQRIVKK